MSFLDSIFGGGNETNTMELPGWMESPAKEIGRNVQRTFVSTGRPPLNQQQNDALNAIESQARGGNPLITQGQNVLSQLFGAGGMTGNQSWLADALAGGQFNNPATGMAGDVAGGSLAYANPALAETARVAMGGDVGNNPYLEATFNRAADVVGKNFRENIVPGMDRSFLSQGRLGSNAYASARNNEEDAYGRNINDLATTVFGGAYENDMARKDAALGQYGQLGQAGVNTMLAGLGMYGDLNQSDVQNRLAGANLDQQGIANLFGATSQLPGMQDLRYDDMQRLFGAGSTREDARYTEAMRAANALNAIPHGQTSTVQANPNVGSQLVGAGTSLLAAYMMSDERLKTDVERTGETPAGVPTYSFRYLWDEPDTERHGVMAHEAAVVFPDAVAATPDGYLAVDYSRVA